MSLNRSRNLVIGIDASNLKRGGGLTHLIELISVLSPKKHSFKKIVVWGSSETLLKLDDCSWLSKITPNSLEGSILSRLLWQRNKLSKLAESEGCDLLFIPGGSFSCSFRPVVTMSRNMLPFEWNEAKRYGFSITTLRMIFLRFLQTKSFRDAQGVIFLTDYAKKQVSAVTGELVGKSIVIPHGLNTRFLIEPKPQLEMGEYTFENPYQLLYVSIIDQYKHQWHVVDAVTKLRKVGYPVMLNLVGPSYPAALKRLTKKIDNLDINRQFIKYLGPISYEVLHDIYKDSHLGIFASSCENMPNILLETMAAGLPIVCSNSGPMPEVLGGSGLYFNPESPNEIYNAIEKYLQNPKLRQQMAFSSFKSVQKYSWVNCADETFSFLDLVSLDYKKSLCAE